MDGNARGRQAQVTFVFDPVLQSASNRNLKDIRPSYKHIFLLFTDTEFSDLEGICRKKYKKNTCKKCYKYEHKTFLTKKILEVGDKIKLIGKPQNQILYG